MPSSTLGGDAIGYYWIDRQHLAIYLIDVTGHGLDSALHAVTIINVLRSAAIPGADFRQPDKVLAALNDAFQASRHSGKYFTLWYGVYETVTRTLLYASGGHPPAMLLRHGEADAQLLPATGSLLGISPSAEFPASRTDVPPGARLYIFSDGVWEVRRERRTLWSLPACIAEIASLANGHGNVMDALLARLRALRGSAHLDDDFSIIEMRTA